MTRHQVGWYRSSDEYTDHLFRKAVLVLRGTRCEVCGQPFKSDCVQVHHVVKKGCELLRWDVRNGAVVCDACHLNNVHGQGWDKFLLDSSPHCEFLTDAKKIVFPDWLARQGKTREEFHKERRAVLKGIIKGHKGNSINMLMEAS